MTWAACTGHPAAPNASKQELRSKGGICSSSCLGISWGLRSKGICLRGLIRITVVCPQA